MKLRRPIGHAQAGEREKMPNRRIEVAGPEHCAPASYDFALFALVNGRARIVGMLTHGALLSHVGAAPMGGHLKLPAAVERHVPLYFRRVFGDERDSHRVLQMGQDAVDPVRPQRAIAAPLAHIVDHQQTLAAREETRKTGLAGKRLEGVVRDLDIALLAAQSGELLGLFHDFEFELFRFRHVTRPPYCAGPAK